jgi:phosphoadenosine phosphosulfate reductase
MTLSSPQFDKLSPQERIKWAVDTYRHELVLTTSFGVQAAVMLHMATSIIPDIPVIFIDTGYHFPETYQFADQLTKRLKLNLKTYVPRQTAAQQEALYGKLWEKGIEGLTQYNAINKVEPMNRAITELKAKAWLAGLRKSQASSREKLTFVQQQNKITKIHPILDLDNKAIHAYLTTNDLPYHPLWEHGYVSIGDWHSTQRLEPGMTEEQTRFNGLKRECGLHENSNRSDYQI